ncbi:MAG: hypothetical protein MUC48_00475 [Leptolyngbya sp. Prado105]|jgi:hypothetical protein|nr:hypothetical protein [Leptolyngbya sp. Prado105]
MLISRVHQFLTSLKTTKLWLGCSIGFALYYGSLALQKAFRSQYVVQDDAREYVFWMQQFIDPTLLPNDLIVQYFKSITPPGYAAIYQVMAMFGVQPLGLSKVLPVGLGLIATVYSFAICLKLFPLPIAGFITTLMLNQSLWFRDDLSSATPRAFVTPLFLAFLYALLCNQRVGMLIVLGLQALIYPPLAFITIVLLCFRLWDWKTRRLDFSQLKFVGLCIGLSAITLLPYALSSREFAPLITRAQAWSMPELHPGGRHPFFNPNPWKFWLIGEHSGIIPPLMPPLIWVGVFLPIVMRAPSRFLLVRQIHSKIALLPQMVWVSFGLFAAAHLLLLRLFFPTRYTTHTLRIVLAISAGIVLTMLLDALCRTCEVFASQHRWFSMGAGLSMVALITIALVAYPQFSQGFPNTNFRVGQDTALYEFLQAQPKNSLIATLADEANNISTFSQRSVLFSREHALPFHLGYYRQIRQRILDTIQAQYSLDLTAAKQTIEKYQINFWLIEQTAFTPLYLTNASWLKSFEPEFTIALTHLQQEKTPALAKLTHCAALNTPRFTLLDAKCISNTSNSGFRNGIG